MSFVTRRAARDETNRLGSKSDPPKRGGKEFDVHISRRHRRATHAMIRLVVWQLPDRPYPSSHPRSLRRTPHDVRA
jgi:hypothetical protein